jgi:integrase
MRTNTLRKLICPIEGGEAQEAPEGLYEGNSAGKWVYAFPLTQEDKEAGRKRGIKKSLFVILSADIRALHPTRKLTLKEAIKYTNIANEANRPQQQQQQRSREAAPPTNKSGFIHYAAEAYKKGLLNFHQKSAGKELYDRDDFGEIKYHRRGGKKGQPKYLVSIDRKLRVLDMLSMKFPNTLLSNITSFDIEELLYGDDSQFPNTTLSKAKLALKGFFGHYEATYPDNLIPIMRLLESKTDIRAIKEPKYRGRLDIKQFEAIRKLAEDNNDTMMVNAVDLAFHTCLRIGNIVKLRFEYDKKTRTGLDGDEFCWSPIKKKNATIRFIDFGLEENKHIKDIIERCKATRMAAMNRGLATTPCPFVVHNNFIRSVPSAKMHPMQVTTTYLTERFSYYRDQLPEMESVPIKNRPTFHEIRSLGASTLRNNNNRTLKEVSDALGHVSVGVTSNYYLNRPEIEEREEVRFS